MARHYGQSPRDVWRWPYLDVVFWHEAADLEGEQLQAASLIGAAFWGGLDEVYKAREFGTDERSASDIIAATIAADEARRKKG